MKKKKNFATLLLGLFLIFSLVGSVAAAGFDLTLETPAESASLSGGAQMLNATIENPAGDLGPYNVSFYYQASGASSWTLISTVTNTSANQASFNTTWDTTAITDQLNLTINATSRDYTNALNSSAATRSHPLDNGNPTASFSSATFNDDYERFGTQTFTLGLAADSTIGISSCTIFCTDSTNSTVYSTTTTTSANACSNTSITPSNFPLPSSRGYNCLVQAMDANTNKTNSSTRLIRYVLEEDGSPVAATSATQGQRNVLQSILGSGSSSVGGFFDTIGQSIRNVFSWIKGIF